MLGARLPLQADNVFRLKALGALGDFKLHRRALLKAAIAFTLNGGEVDENVLSRRALDETVALAGVEPLHCSLFSQLYTP